MKDRVWNLYSDPVFSFVSTPIKVNEQNVKEIILSIDETIIMAGFKYRVYELFPNNRFFEDLELKLSYKKDRLKNFWINSRGENIYSILQTHQWLKNIESLKTKIAYPASVYFILDESNIKMKYHSAINPLISVYSNIFRLDNDNEQNLEIVIESYSDIWYEKVFDLKEIDIMKSNIDDSKLNTPRLNSFLREIESELIKYNSKLEKDTEGNIYNNFTTENRILTDGAIVYQDDIQQLNF